MAMSAATTGDLQTVGQIARQEGVPAHRVDYAIQRYNIADTQRVGILRVYDDAGVEAIKSALRRIENGGRS